MALWSYTKPPKVFTPAQHGTMVAKEHGWVLVRPDGTEEIIVAIDRFNEKHDYAVENLEMEDGFNFIMEDSSVENSFIILES
jgi:phosphomannomutase